MSYMQQVKALLRKGKEAGITASQISSLGAIDAQGYGKLDLSHFERALKAHWQEHNAQGEALSSTAKIYIGSKVSLWEPETHEFLGYAVAHSSLNIHGRFVN